MDNRVSIKKVCLYNKDLYDQTTKKEKKKRIIWTIVSLLITLISIFDIVYSITNDLVKYFVVLYAFLIIIAIIFFFIFMYNLFSLCTFLTQKAWFLDIGYALTNNDEIIKFNYEKNSPYSKYDTLKDNLLDEIVKILSLQISVSKENKETTEKIKEKNLELNNLYDCLNIVNVYKIKEKADCIEIVCDYIDLIKNTSCKKQSLTIYKYYENWEEILNQLKIQKGKPKKELIQRNSEHSGFAAFVLAGSLRKSNAIWFHIFFAFALFGSVNDDYLFAIWLEFGIAILISILYFQKRALKYLDNNENDAKEFLLGKIKNNKIVLTIYSMLLLVYLVINIDEMSAILITAICICVILFMFKKKIEK